MWYRILLVVASCAIGPLGLVAAEADAEKDSSAALPKEYAAKYLLAAHTLSPDKKIGIIYPKADLCDQGSEKDCKDFLVQLKPFKVLATIETESPHFQNKNYGGIDADWANNKSAVVVTVESKWGPADIFLYELKARQLARSTDLLRKIHDLLVPDFRKAMNVRSKDQFGFMIEKGDKPMVEVKGSTVRINADATTDPKRTPGVKAWDGRVEAVWDIPRAKFTSQKVERLFAGIRKDE
jgi:hypothetical protein